MSDTVSSYFKTIIVAALIAMAACATLVAVNGPLRGFPARALDAVAAVALGLGGSIVASGLLTVNRARRVLTNAPDLYLTLNRTRAADAVAARRARRRSVRRLFGRRMLGHDFLVGDWVEVRSLAEIRATLDANGELDAMPFMPEMAKFCGARARVFRCADKIYDYGRTKKMRRLEDCVLLVGLRCDGAAHGGCQAGCLVTWKTSWLKRIPEHNGAVPASLPVAGDSFPAPPPDAARHASVRFTCQFTQLHAATHEFRPWDLRRDLRPLVAGNVALGAFLVAIATRWFNVVQSLRGGQTFPATPPGLNEGGPSKQSVVAGDVVVVRPLADIARTLDRQHKNRGLWFDDDMVRHCGQRYRVQGPVERIIDAATGNLLHMKSPCIVLEGVECSGEFQFFGAQQEYIYWREAWLAKASPPDLQTRAS